MGSARRSTSWTCSGNAAARDGFQLSVEDGCNVNICFHTHMNKSFEKLERLMILSAKLLSASYTRQILNTSS
jgi:hypothetical protein